MQAPCCILATILLAHFRRKMCVVSQDCLVIHNVGLGIGPYCRDKRMSHNVGPANRTN